jgi:protein-S-isoprenylcysteine O-methyltransferase Ste14
MLQLFPVAELVLCWVAGSFAFWKARKHALARKKVVRAPASRWGIFLEGIGFALVWLPIRPQGFEKSAASLIVSMLLGPPSVALAWAATRHLGKHWRYEAALNEDHELVQTGPYRWVRHPIYSSMLGMLLATGAAWTWWPVFIAALIVFLSGTEIRVRSEDGLLEERFQAAFVAYRSRVPAYIPFIR